MSAGMRTMPSTPMPSTNVTAKAGSNCPRVACAASPASSSAEMPSSMAARMSWVSWVAAAMAASRSA